MTREPPAEQALATLGRLLTDLGLEPERDEKVAGFHIDFGGDGPRVTAFAAIAPESRRFVFYIDLGIEVDSGRRDEMARLLARLNWQLMVGSFDMDYADGQVRFRVAIDFGDGELTEGLMRSAILAAMNAVEAHARVLLRVAAGQSAEEAIEATHTNA